MPLDSGPQRRTKAALCPDLRHHAREMQTRVGEEQDRCAQLEAKLAQEQRKNQDLNVQIGEMQAQVENSRETARKQRIRALKFHTVRISFGCKVQRNKAVLRRRLSRSTTNSNR